MGINSSKDVGFGQLGSVFNDGTAAMSPPAGKVFVAITMLKECTFDTSGGLIADLTSAGLQYIGTEAAAHDLNIGSETTSEGGGGQQVNVDNKFPQGITIYGRWTKVNPASGTCIAYIGK